MVEQSGLRAGDGGFQVTVQGHTALQGGILSSSALAVERDANRLTTGTLSHSDLNNSATLNAESSGVSVSSDMAGQGKYGAAKALIANSLNNADGSSSSSGQTRATVGAGRIVITDEEGQRQKTGQTAAQTVAALSRNADAAHTAAKTQDVQAMQEQVETERAIRQAFVKATFALMDEGYRSRFGNKPKLVKVECASAEECVKNPELVMRTPATKDEIANAAPDSILAVNGILNDEKRAAELAFQNTLPDQQTGKKPEVFYLMVIEPANNTISELLGVAYEKITASADYSLAKFLGYTNAQVLYADLLRSRGDLSTLSLGHSRGTLIQEAAFTILANGSDENGNFHTNPNLSVRGVGGAADAEEFSKKAASIVNDPSRNGQITYSYFSNDPVATSNLSGGNPGLWRLSDLLEVFETNNSMHSCYGTGANGCTQVEAPMPGGPQGTPEGNAKLIQYVGGKRVEQVRSVSDAGEKK